MDIHEGDIVRVQGEVISLRHINGGLYSAQVRTEGGDFWFRSDALSVVPPEPPKPSRQARPKKNEVEPAAKNEIDPPADPPVDPSENDDPDGATEAPADPPQE